MSNILNSIKIQIGNNEYIDLTFSGNTYADFNSFCNMLENKYKHCYAINENTSPEFGKLTWYKSIKFKGNKHRYKFIPTIYYGNSIFTLTLYADNVMLLEMNINTLDKFGFHYNTNNIKKETSLKDIYSLARMTLSNNRMHEYKIGYDNITVEMNDPIPIKEDEFNRTDEELHLIIYGKDFIPNKEH